MRITTSDSYGKHHNRHCRLDDCERLYCSGKTHRLLFRTCDTEIVREGESACWEDGGDKFWDAYTGECPKCHQEDEKKRWDRMAAEWEARQKQEGSHV